MSAEFNSAREYAEKRIEDRESFNVLVDVEGTTHMLKDGIARVINDYLDYKKPVNRHFIHRGDFDGWTEITAAEKLGDAMNWPEKYDFFGGYEDFPGFHTISNIIWTESYEDLPWVEEGIVDYEDAEQRYGVEMIEEVPKEMEKLVDMDHVGEVEIVTSRGNFFGDGYNVEDSLEETLVSDLSGPKLSEDWVRNSIYFVPPEESKINFHHSKNFQIFLDDSLSLWQEIQKEENKIQLSRSMPDNTAIDSYGRKKDFSGQVRVVEDLG